MGLNAVLNLFKVVKRFPATIAIALLLLFSYFLLSQGNLFIEKSLLKALSFSFGKPFNILLYLLTHTSLWHLAVNTFTLLFFAAIVETELKSKDVVGIFLFSGTLTVALFSFFNPGTMLIGASAGVFGLMASAFVLNPRKTIAALGIVMALFLLIFPVASFLVQGQQEGLVEKNIELGNALRNAIKSDDQQRATAIASQKSVAEAQLVSFSQSKQFASTTQTDPFLHSYAAIFGIAYLLAFRRKQTMASVRKQKRPASANKAKKKRF